MQPGRALDKGCLGRAGLDEVDPDDFGQKRRAAEIGWRRVNLAGGIVEGQHAADCIGIGMPKPTLVKAHPG